MNAPEDKKQETLAAAPEDAPAALSETWAEDAQDDLEEWIELQGIQLRF